MTSPKILILDDTSHGADSTETSIRTGSGIIRKPRKFSEKAFRDHLALFWKHALPVLDKEKSAETAKRELAKEWQADILFIDNNLTELPRPNDQVYDGPLTAESIIGFLRAFAPITYIVSLNKNPEVSLDLTALVGDRTTSADIALNTYHLTEKGLWKTLVPGSESFSPSYWPKLLDASSRRLKQIALLESRLDEPLLPLIGIEIDTKLGQLSDRALGALSPAAERTTHATSKGWRELTARQFFILSCKTLSQKLRLLLQQDDKVVASVVASELEAWLRRDVMAPQDTVVTIPHLIARMPFLLKPGASRLATWNSAAASTTPPFGMNAARYNKYIKQHRTAFDIWLGVPTFWWDDVRSMKELIELSSAEPMAGDFVFCEDISRFRKRESGKSPPREFVADVDGAWRQRFVARRDPRYSPAVRFSL